MFESIGVVNESPGNLTAPGEMEAVGAASPSDNFLETLGMTPLGERDPLTFAAVAGLLAAVALAASALPAIRASRVDPMLALRSK